VWTDQSYIIASCGFNTDPADELYIATVGLLGYVIEASVGIGYGFPKVVEPVPYYFPRVDLIRIKININNKETIKEYVVPPIIARVFAKFLNHSTIVTSVIANFINSIKDIIIRANNYDRDKQQ